MSALAQAAPLPLIGHRSRKRIRPFRLARPQTVEEAVALWSAAGGDGALLAGGVDLINALKEGARYGDVIALGGIAALAKIEVEADRIVLGAMVTHAALAAAPLPGALAALCARWRGIANPRIRRKGTLGGNLMVASPGYDLPPCLLALGGEVIGYAPGGAPVMEPFAGRLDAGRLFITGIRLPADLAAFAYDRAERPALSAAVAARQAAGADSLRLDFGLSLHGELTKVSVPVGAGMGLSAVRAAAAELAEEAAREAFGADGASLAAQRRRRLAAAVLRRAIAQLS